MRLFHLPRSMPWPFFGPIISLTTMFLLWMRDRQVEQEKKRKAVEAKKKKEK